MSSDNRNRELDEAVSGPHIESPDELDVGDGQLCWIDNHRLCGPDCKAFNMAADQGPDQCLILNRGGKAVESLIQIEHLIRARQSSVPKV